MTPHFTLEASFHFVATQPTDPTLGQFLDAAVSHLEEELDAEDLFVASDDSMGWFSVSILIPSSAGETIETVVGKGMGMLRTAFHACHSGTPNWPSMPEALLSVRVTPATLISEFDGPPLALPV